MDDLWNQIRVLEGQTLTTTIQRRPFIVGPVTQTTVVITPQRSNTLRTIQRSVIEDAWALHDRGRDITPERLRDKVGGENRNLSYIAAILKAVQGG